MLKLLSKDEDSEECKDSWNYWKVIGTLNYLSVMTEKNILFVIHQCVCFMNKPMWVHEITIKQIVYYLKVTHSQGYIINLTAEK